ncbi:MAG: eukaryotic-like serine/threonine-protein kinase [Acidobacteriota bacterium]|jgi:serine/threonine protein kinase|nr:eukaryotic-like serine/threonine-protein kinase [Acidobacteriota bacterium]
MLAPNTLLQNRYLIVRAIGHGGMGTVYLARDERLAHTVALKETFFTDERLRKAFEREARLLAHLRHPALPKVTDHFDEDGGQFIVMEFIAGDDLEMLLAQRGKPFPIDEVVHWGDELLKALDYLHKQDPPILHRDIKPANLKLTPQNEIILLDFGLAKGTAGQTPSVMTSKSIFGFTPNFAPLEQIQGTGTGPRSDLYSLAATLYYLMTGAIPPDALTRITEVANGKPDPLRRPDEINPQIPVTLADILMKTMAHNRDHRPSGAAEMRRMLHEVSPRVPSVLAFGSIGVEVAEPTLIDNVLLPSTLIESNPTQESPAAKETAASRTPALVTAEAPPSKLETAPAQAPLPETSVARKGLRLPWAIAGFVLLMMIGVTIGIVSNSSAEKASAAPSTQLRDAGPVTEPISQRTVAAPDDSEISTATDALGAEIKTRTFRRNGTISRIVLSTRDGKQSVKVYSISGEERELPPDLIATAFEASGDSLAAAAGFTGAEQKGQALAKADPRKVPSIVNAGRKPAVAIKPQSQTTAPINSISTNPPRGSQSGGLQTQQNKDEPGQLQNTIPKKGSSQPRAIKN